MLNSIKIVLEFLYENVKEFSALIAISAALIGLSKWRVNKINERQNRLDLSDFFNEDSDPNEYKKNYIETQCVDRPPDEEDELSESYETSNREELAKFFLKQVFTKDSKKLYLVLGGAGMGKTTFLLNLFFKYNSKSFRTKRKWSIKYIPLGDPNVDYFIELFKKKDKNGDGSRTILLLDAFDEDPKALDNYDERLNDLVNNTRTFRKVIITSRTQFFPEEEKENFSLVIPTHGKTPSQKKFIKKYIAPFSEYEIDRYLSKKYGRRISFFGLKIHDNHKRIAAKTLISKAKNLIARPMLLDFIDILIEDDYQYKDECDVYNHLIDKWIERESDKQIPNTSINFKEHMHKFISEAAYRIYRNHQNGYGLFIDIDDVVAIANEQNLDLKKIDLSARSLLNRNTKGRLKFSHKSILEFLLANFDANCYNPEKFIDFNSFDFGLKLRNRLAYKKLDGISKQIFTLNRSLISHTKFYLPLGITKKIDMHSQFLLITNYDFIENRILRVFENLEEIYMINDSEFFNIKNLKISLRSSKRNKIDSFYELEYSTGKGKQFEEKVYRFIFSLNKSDPFFEKRGIKVYTSRRIFYN